MDLQSSLFLDQRVGIISPLDEDRASNSWHQVKFDVPFSEDKNVVIIPMTQTYNGAATPNLRIQNVTRLGFEIRIDELIGNAVDTSLADGSHAPEIVGWVAYGFYPSAGSTSNLPTAGKYYYIGNKKSSKYLDVADGSTADGGNIQQYSKANGDNQKWEFQDAGDGYYYIISKKSGKAVGVAGGSTGNTADGANVIQWAKAATSDDQKWKLEDAGDGYFYIVNKNSGKVLDVASSSLVDKGNVIQYQKAGGDNQKWKFEAV